MTEQQVTGPVDEAQAPSDAERSESQGGAPARPSSEPDPLAAAAVELARAAAEEVAQPGTVGRHLSVSRDPSGLTLHAFDCTATGYRGWRWAVTLAHVPGSDRVTVCDSVLLPGAESIMAPDWVPWSDRLAPGDLGAGDELPYKQDDPNLVPGYTVTDEDDADQQLFWELGLGRERVLGREGVSAAADRWHRGPHGPTADIAVQAAASCVSCAYFVPLSGIMRQHFGACANEWSPADGSVVTADFGCGAHSETDLEMPAPEPLNDHILDETVVDRMDLLEPEPGPGIETGTEAETDPGTATDLETADAAVAEAGTQIEAEVLGEQPLPTESDLGPVPVDAAPEDTPAAIAASEDVIAVHTLAEDGPVIEEAAEPTAAGDAPVPAELADTVEESRVVRAEPETDQAPPVALAAEPADPQQTLDPSGAASAEVPSVVEVPVAEPVVAEVEGVAPDEVGPDEVGPDEVGPDEAGALGVPAAPVDAEVLDDGEVPVGEQPTVGVESTDDAEEKPSTGSEVPLQP